MRGFLKNEKGIALVTALLFMVISMAIILSVLYLITQGGTSVSSLTRQYHSLKEAAYGGAEFSAQQLIPNVASGKALSTLTYGGLVLPYMDDVCFAKKMKPDANAISPLNWGSCAATGLNLDPSAGGGSDFRVQLSGTASQAPYYIFVKIVGSTLGNTDTSIGVLSNLGVVDSSAATPVHVPYTYRVEILAQRVNNPSERVSLSGLLVY
jgi:hypothetical protein